MLLCKGFGFALYGAGPVSPAGDYFHLSGPTPLAVGHPVFVLGFALAADQEIVTNLNEPVVRHGRIGAFDKFGTLAEAVYTTGNHAKDGSPAATATLVLPVLYDQLCRNQALLSFTMQHNGRMLLAAMPNILGAPVLFDHEMLAGIHTGLIYHRDGTHVDTEVSSSIMQFVVHLDC